MFPWSKLLPDWLTVLSTSGETTLEMAMGITGCDDPSIKVYAED